MLKSRICKRCGSEYIPTAAGQKYCGSQKQRGTCSWQVGNEISKKWLLENPEKKLGYRQRWAEKLRADPERYEQYLARCRRKDLRRQGITQEEYDAQYKRQGGVCAICGLTHGRSLMGRSKDLAIDHDHQTNELRGLLCDDCNIGLGIFRDDPERLLVAAWYLLAYKNRSSYKEILIDQLEVSMFRKITQMPDPRANWSGPMVF